MCFLNTLEHRFLADMNRPLPLCSLSSKSFQLVEYFVSKQICKLLWFSFSFILRSATEMRQKWTRTLWCSDRFPPERAPVSRHTHTVQQLIGGCDVLQDGKLLLTSASWSSPLSALWSMDGVFTKTYDSPTASCSTSHSRLFLTVCFLSQELVCRRTLRGVQ